MIRENMVPHEEGSANYSQNANGFSFRSNGYGYENNFVCMDEQENRSTLAYEEFTRSLEKTRTSLTQEELKKLLVWAYQGCDLRYQRKCDSTPTNL